MNVASEFNKIAKEYDDQRKKLIPVFDDFYQIAIESVELNTKKPRVLEIGTGTGLFSEMFLNKFSEAKMDLVDLAEDMLNIAKERFSNNINLSFFVENILDFSTYEKYDLVISSLAIHHLEIDDQEILYNKIFDWLKNDGIFVNAEMIAGESEFTNNMYEKWIVNKASDNSLDEKAKSAAIERLKLDKKVPVSTHLEWLKNAGFSYFDHLYKAYCFAVLWAKK
ncbi:MAG: class I SAM-dependent methyltransferase [Methanobacteriaceae archaeon]|jgi:tRNA (cmo5U34)-methyltransferase|nr:class I SAM-dependent methyltransferase [Candidatus Methanorudis spinitermitis]